MVDIVKGALYVGSAVILYQGITKEKVLTNEKIRHGTIGALAGLLLGPKLEDMIRNDKSLTEEQKRKILSTSTGAVIGGGLGYALSDKVAGYLTKNFASYKKTPQPEST